MHVRWVGALAGALAGALGAVAWAGCRGGAASDAGSGNEDAASVSDSGGGTDGGPADAGPPAPPAPPPEQAALYAEVEAGLAAFEAEVDARRDGSPPAPVDLAGALFTANPNAGPALLVPEVLAATNALLDRYASMGVAAVKVDINFPLLTQAFHDHLAAADPLYAGTAAAYLAFYEAVAQATRDRGMTLLVEHASLFPGISSLDPGGYYDEIRALGPVDGRTRYRDERAAEAAAIASAIAPERLTLLAEPGTQNDNFGPIGAAELYTPDQWSAYLQFAALEIAAAAPPTPVLLGGGAGTWDAPDYVDLFAAHPDLDYVDLHLYPVQVGPQQFFLNLLDWSEQIHATDPTKSITVGECWLYKAGLADFGAGATAPIDVYGRDVWSFWAPLDQRFLQVMYDAAGLEDIAVVAPFWSAYYFAYLEWGDPAVAGLDALALIGAAAQRALAAVPAGPLTWTGATFESLAGGAN